MSEIISKVTLTEVRLSFPDLFTPRAQQNADGTLKEPVYAATFILDNTKHNALLDSIDLAIDRVALDFFKKKVSLRHRCLRDGNERAETDGYGDGVSFIKAWRKTRPAVVNWDMSPLQESDGVIYAGCYVNATIDLFAYDHKTGGKGVSATLRAVQFVKHGESFGAGKVDPENEFKPVAAPTEPGGQQQPTASGSGRSTRSTASSAMNDSMF